MSRSCIMKSLNEIAQKLINSKGIKFNVVLYRKKKTKMTVRIKWVATAEKIAQNGHSFASSEPFSEI